MRISATFIFLAATAAALCGQMPAAPAGACSKNISFAVAEGGQPVPAIPKFTAKWVDKKLQRQDYKDLCFSQIPSSSMNNYVVIFSTSEAMFEGLTPSAHTYTSATTEAGNTTKASSYGGTWSYAYAGVPPPKTTTTLDLRRDDKPKSLFVHAYNQQGRSIASYNLAAFPSREKLVEYVLAAILGDAVATPRLVSKLAPLSVYYVNCDVDSPAVQTAMASPPPVLTAEPSVPPPPPPPPAPLEIVSTPPGADISLDGMSIGKTPHSLVVPTGEHVITLRKQDFGTWERKVMVDANKRRITAYLEQKSLAINFSSEPTALTAATKAAAPQAILDFWSSPAGADVFVDGGYVGKTPYSLSITPGQHTVSLRKKDFGIWERKLVVDAGKRKVGATLEQKALALQ